MENRIQHISSEKNSRITIGIIPGHFATNHSHVNYYVDLTSVKTSTKIARETAKELGADFSDTHIDTIICLEGTQIIGAFLADYLSQTGMNRDADIDVVTPELNSVNQLIFRDNTQNKIWNKQVLLLISSASTGKTINRTVDCLQYYSGQLTGVAAIFSAIREVDGIKVKSVFTENELPHYETFSPAECPMCKAGKKVDALINSFGYSKI